MSGQIRVKSIVVDIVDRLDTSLNNVDFFDPFLHGDGVVFAVGVLFLRYTTYGQSVTSLCLRLEGDHMVVSCKTPMRDQTVVTTAEAPTTDGHAGKGVTYNTINPPFYGI